METHVQSLLPIQEETQIHIPEEDNIGNKFFYPWCIISLARKTTKVGHDWVNNMDAAGYSCWSDSKGKMLEMK